MSAAAIKQQIDQMSKDERFYVAAYLQHLENEEDAAYRSAVADSMSRMDGGDKVSFEELVARHEALERQGK
jgi:hypothetical protein